MGCPSFVTNFITTSNINYSLNFLSRTDFHTIFEFISLSAFRIWFQILSINFGIGQKNDFYKVIFWDFFQNIFFFNFFSFFFLKFFCCWQFDNFFWGGGNLKKITFWKSIFWPLPKLMDKIWNHIRKAESETNSKMVWKSVLAKKLVE